MIAEIIFAIIMGAISGYIVYRFMSIYEKRKILKNIKEKVAKQDKKFFVGKKEMTIFHDKK